MDRDWIEKLESERPLGIEDSHRLDQALEAQQPVTRLVSGLTDDVPSLEWRSSLNARLAAHARRPRRLWIGWASGLATTLACAAALVAFAPKQGTTPTTPGQTEASVEEILMSAHNSAEAQEHLGLDAPVVSDSL
jgi:hypothetical protein